MNNKSPVDWLDGVCVSLHPGYKQLVVVWWCGLRLLKELAVGRETVHPWKYSRQPKSSRWSTSGFDLKEEPNPHLRVWKVQPWKGLRCWGRTFQKHWVTGPKFLRDQKNSEAVGKNKNMYFFYSYLCIIDILYFISFIIYVLFVFILRQLTFCSSFICLVVGNISVWQTSKQTGGGGGFKWKI